MSVRSVTCVRVSDHHIDHQAGFNMLSLTLQSIAVSTCIYQKGLRSSCLQSLTVCGWIEIYRSSLCNPRSLDGHLKV
jgi:hypothetical protein